MNPRHASFLALSSLILAFGPFGWAQTAVTDPVGFHTITINPGLRTVGLPLVRSAVGAGLVQSSTSPVVTANSAAINFGSLLTATTAYYLELTNGPANSYIGDRFDVDVAATIASGNSTVTINTASPNNTTAGSLPDLTGYSFVIRPHITIGYIFGTKGNTPMQGSTSVNSADQIQFYVNSTGGYDAYYLLRNSTGSVEEWRKIAGGTTKYDNLVIPPGVGMFVKRNGTSQVLLTVTGEVRTSSFFAQNLRQGLNLISEGFPVSSSPLNRDCTTANNFVGSTSTNSADQVQVWNTTTGGYDAYYLLKTSTLEQWRKIAGGTTNYATTNIFTLDGAVFLKKISALPNYAAPKTF